MLTYNEDKGMIHSSDMGKDVFPAVGSAVQVRPVAIFLDEQRLRIIGTKINS